MLQIWNRGGLSKAGELKLGKRTFLVLIQVSYSPVLSSATYIRSLLGDSKLSGIEAWSEQEKMLSAKLAKLIVDLGSEINQQRRSV